MDLAVGEHLLDIAAAALSAVTSKILDTRVQDLRRKMADAEGAVKSQSILVIGVRALPTLTEPTIHSSIPLPGG
jgi:hypothetical protein